LILATMAEQNLTELALVEVAYMLSPLKSLNNADKVTSFFVKLGYTLPSGDVISSFEATLDKTDVVIIAAKELMSAEDAIPKLQALANLVLAVKGAVDEMKNLTSAIKALPGLTSNFANNAPLSDLPLRLLDYLIYEDLYTRHPKLFGVMLLMGILDEKVLTADTTKFQPACNLKVVKWDRIPRYMTEPGTVIDEVYKWSTDFDSDLFVKRFEIFLRAMAIPGGIYKQGANVKAALGNTTNDLNELRLPVFQKGISSSAHTLLGINFAPAEAKSGMKKGIAVIPYFVGSTQTTFDINEKWEALLSASLALDAGLGLILRPPFAIETLNTIFTTPANAATIDVSLTGQQKKINGSVPAINIFGSEVGSQMSMNGLSAKIFAKSSSIGQDAGVEIAVKNIKIVLSIEDGDSFLAKVLPGGGIKATFGLGLIISLQNGFYLTGSSSMEVQLPVHTTLGPVKIENVLIAVKPENRKIPIDIVSTIRVELGPIKLVVEKVGLSAPMSFPGDRSGNLGPINCNLNFKPPTGVALSIDTEGIKGGGFLTINTATGEYRGGLVLGFRDKFTFRAVAIINTKLPGGEPGFSLFVMITADFQPVQLGFGFTLNAVGGLFGYNRTVEVDKLNELVRSGKASQLLFPPADADLPTIVNTAAEVYPVRVGNFVFGPMAKIGWGTPTIVMAEIALIIEVPDPVRVGMLGVIRVVLPDAGSPAPTIRLNMAFFAVVDFAKKMFSLQASLFDSKLLSVTLSGDFAVYMSWGQQRMFIFSAGGFHPAYKEAPPQLASMRRLNLTLIDDKKLKIAATTYLAITSNTVQFGSHIVLWCKFENVQINGQFWFDVLFQFDPFRFQAEMGLIASLSVDKNELAAIRIIGRLNGPGPWYVWGEAYIKVWFIEIKVEVEHSWGEEPPALAPKTANVKQMLLGEVQKKENWTTVPVPGSAISGISVRDLSKIPEIVLMPNCLLTFRQKVVPLGIEIQKFGEALPQPGENKFEITGQIAKYDGAVEIHPANELFARANYLVLNDEEKLSYPSFEEFKGGITLGLGNNSAVQLGAEEAYNYDEYEVKYLGQEKATKLPAFKQMFLQELKGSAAYRSPLSLEQNRPGREAIAPIIPAGGEYVIMRKADLTALGESGSGEKRFKNFTEAEQYLKDLKIPQFADRYSIVSTLEL
jgi:hypothetical protein